MYKKYSGKVDFAHGQHDRWGQETKKKRPPYQRAGIYIPVYYDTEQEVAYNYQAESSHNLLYQPGREIVSGARGVMEESALEAQIKSDKIA